MKKVVSILVVLALATAAQAAVTASHDGGVPTTLLPGFTTYTASLTTSTGVIEGAALQLVAPANDLNHLFGGGTVYADLNFLMATPPMHPSQDTQVPWVTNTDVLSALAVETTGMLNADWAFIGGVGNPNALPTTVVLQVVLPVGSTAVLSGAGLTGGQMVGFTPITIPEPASMALLGIGGLGALLRRKR